MLDGTDALDQSTSPRDNQFTSDLGMKAIQGGPRLSSISTKIGIVLRTSTTLPEKGERGYLIPQNSLRSWIYFILTTRKVTY